jgi:hypothetical protein
VRHFFIFFNLNYNNVKLIKYITKKMQSDISNFAVQGQYSYNPVARQAAVNLANSRRQQWAQEYRTLQQPAQTGYMGGVKIGSIFNSDWMNNGATSTQSNAITEVRENLEKTVNQRYPFTYVIPEEEKYHIQRRFTNDDGQALSMDRYTGVDPAAMNSTMGQVFLGPEYFDYAAKEMERDQAVKFKTWVLNNMDISSLLKKEYWKKRAPVLYQELISALLKKQAQELKLSMLNLVGPDNEADWEYVYTHMVQPELYNKPMQADGSTAPTVLPYPQSTSIQNNANGLRTLKI